MKRLFFLLLIPSLVYGDAAVCTITGSLTDVVGNALPSNKTTLTYELQVGIRVEDADDSSKSVPVGKYRHSVGIADPSSLSLSLVPTKSGGDITVTPHTSYKVTVQWLENGTQPGGTYSAEWEVVYSDSAIDVGTILVPETAVTVLNPISSGDSAGGDLDGTFPNPTVDGIQTVNVSSTAPTDGQVLVYESDYSEYYPQAQGGESTTVDDTATLDLTLSGSQITGDVLEAGVEALVDHDDTQGVSVTSGTDYNHLTNAQHDTLTGGLEDADSLHKHALADAHIANTANPHSTDVENLGSGTLAELNSAITDATLDDSSDTRPPTAHASDHQHSGGDEVGTATPGANAIPKAEADGKLAVGWYDPSDLEGVIDHDDTQNISVTSGTDYNHLTDAQHDTLTGGLEDADGLHKHALADAHIADTSSNPHSVDIGTLGTGTLAELNTAVTDATLDDSSASRPPSGAAGGDLSGTYPNPSVDNDSHTHTEAFITDLAHTTARGVTVPMALDTNAVSLTYANPFGLNVSDELILRYRSTSVANFPVEANDARLSDSRAPTGVAGGDLNGTYPNPSVDDLSLNGDVTGTLSATVVGDDSHSHTEAFITDLAHTTARGVNVPLALDGNSISMTYANPFGLNGSSQMILRYRSTAVADFPVEANDARLSDSRAPTGVAGGDLNGTYPNPSVDDLSLGGDVTGTLSATVVGDDSHNHTEAFITDLAHRAATSPLSIATNSVSLSYDTKGLMIAGGELELAPGRKLLESGIPTDGEVMKYQSGSGTWEFAADATGSGFAVSQKGRLHSHNGSAEAEFPLVAGNGKLLAVDESATFGIQYLDLGGSVTGPVTNTAVTLASLTAWDLNGNSISDGTGDVTIGDDATITGTLTVDTITAASGLDLSPTGYFQATATTHALLRSGAGQNHYYDSGALYLWRDVDGAFATRMTLNSANGDLTLTGDLDGGGSDISNFGTITATTLSGALTAADMSFNVPMAADTTKISLTFTDSLKLNGSSELDLNYRSTSAAGYPVEANDSRLSDSRAPNGTAGGDLNGTYPNPSVDDLAVGGEVSGTLSAILITESNLENGGASEISAAGLSGQLADPQLFEALESGSDLGDAQKLNMITTDGPVDVALNGTTYDVTVLYPEYYYSGGYIAYLDSDTVEVTGTAIWLRAANADRVIKLPVGTQCDISTTGAGGRDTGDSDGADVLLHLYAVDKNDGTGDALYASSDETVVQGDTLDMPSGYSLGGYRQLRCWVVNDSNSDILRFQVMGMDRAGTAYRYLSAIDIFPGRASDCDTVLFDATINAQTFVEIDASSYAPSVARYLRVKYGMANNNGALRPGRLPNSPPDPDNPVGGTGIVVEAIANVYEEFGSYVGTTNVTSGAGNVFEAGNGHASSNSASTIVLHTAYITEVP